MTLLMGVDVSKYQGVVDWSRLKEYGYTFAIIRAGYGMYEKQEDPYFIRNITEAIDKGFDIGVYWFSYATNEFEVSEEARICYEIIEPYLSNINIGVFFDYEYDSVDYYYNKYGRNPTASVTADFFVEFHRYFKNRGIKTGIYTNHDFITSYFKGLDYDSKEFLLWFSDPSNNYRDNYSWDICQTGILEIDGVNFDINIMPEHITEKPAEDGYIVYTIKSGDTLSGIASKYGATLSQLLAWNPEYKTNPNIIYTGQTVKIKILTASGYAVGDIVKIKKSAQYYAGVSVLIPEYYKGVNFTVMQVKADRLLLQEIYSWVSINDVEKAD